MIPGWPWLTLVWPLTPALDFTSEVLPTKFGSHRTFLSNLSPGWPFLTPVWPLTPALHFILFRVLPTKFGSHRAFLRNMILGWPRLTPGWPLTPALHFSQGFFLPNLVAIGHSWAICPLVDPGCPLYDLWPQHCTSLWSGVLPTKFGSHWAFLKQLDLWSGHFENMLSNLMSPSPTPVPSFSLIPQSRKKYIAVRTYTPTYIQTWIF